MLSSYKKNCHWQSFNWNFTSQTRLLLSDIFPDSISNSALSGKSGVVDWVEPEYELMLGRGFSVQEHCAFKGVFLNYPAQKITKQFCSVEITSNFDVAACRIHNKNFIGCVRDWSILNSVSSIQRLKILSSVCIHYIILFKLCYYQLDQSLRNRKKSLFQSQGVLIFVLSLAYRAFGEYFTHLMQILIFFFTFSCMIITISRR